MTTPSSARDRRCTRRSAKPPPSLPATRTPTLVHSLGQREPPRRVFEDGHRAVELFRAHSDASDTLRALECSAFSNAKTAANNTGRPLPTLLFSSTHYTGGTGQNC